MTEVNKNKVRTDEAWRHLYTRLDKDSLLVEVGEEVIRRRLFLNCSCCYAGRSGLSDVRLVVNAGK